MGFYPQSEGPTLPTQTLKMVHNCLSPWPDGAGGCGPQGSHGGHEHELWGQQWRPRFPNGRGSPSGCHGRPVSLPSMGLRLPGFTGHPVLDRSGNVLWQANQAL